MLLNYGTCAVMVNQKREWDYTPLSQDTVILTEYLGTSQNVVVPLQIRINPVISQRSAGLITDTVTQTKDADSITGTVTDTKDAGNITL